MNINIEVFDKEPIENIVTCLNYKMDKVIFFGQEDVMTVEARNFTKQILKDLCDIERVEFEVVSMKNIDRVFANITKIVEQEEARGGKCFFDLTGGADVVLVAMGMYSATHNIPMHRYDIEDQQLRILNLDAEHIDQCVEKQEIKLTIEDLVKLQCGMVDRDMQKGFKDGLADEALRQDIYALWQVASRDMDKWSEFSAVLKAAKTSKFNKFDPQTVPVEWLEREKVHSSVGKQDKIFSEDSFVTYLEELQKAGCISKLTTHMDWISFSYKSNHIRSWMLDAGSLLELHTYFERLDSGLYDDCKIGTHLKWGDETTDNGYMVNNEIDVLLLRGYVLTFISCKAGDPDQMALYELDTVASRFGGKYAQKELVTAGKMEIHHARRAEEMGITVVKV